MFEALLWFVAVCQALTAALWWFFWFFQKRLKLNEISLPAVKDWPADQPSPSLAVLIACHNEEDGIEACIRRLQGQTYPNMTFVVADDRSTDRTGEILQRLATEDPRVRPVTINDLPPNWTGKTHALSVAIESIKEDYVLFMDCDVELVPHALSSVMHKVCQDKLDFFSFWPYLDLRSPSERLLIPPAMTVLSLWAKPRGSSQDIVEKTIMGNGQFMLVKRSSYEAIGGHQGVSAELAEDAILAHKAHAAGQRCWSGPGKELYLVYREGAFSRSANSLARVLIGSLQAQWRLLASTQVLIGGCFAPGWVLPTAVICLALGFNPALCLTFTVFSILHWTGLVLALRDALSNTLAKRGSLFWFPFGSAVVAGILFWSAYLFSGRGTLRWGKTYYRVKGTQITAV